MQDVTMTTPGLMKMTHVAYCGVRSPLDSAKLRRAYEYVVEAWTRLGIPPDHVFFEGADFEHPLKGYTFKRGRKKFEAVDPAECKSFGLGLPISGLDERGGTWPMAQFHMTRCYGETTVWNPFLGVHPPAAGISYEEAERHLLEFAGIVAGSYGYIVRRRGMVASSFFWAGGTISGGDFDADTQEEHVANITQYGFGHEFQAQEVVLRDLFPINLLGQRFLGLPFGDTGHTLRDWIEQNPDDRGILEPLEGAEHVLVWRPPLERLPELRTELFRAGRLFYWRHFLRSQPECRDFSKPFKPPKEVPAIFRPEFYAGRDPRVTR